MAILYKANETDFSHFGLGPLNDAVSILVTEERNGIFELTMEYPVSGSQFEDLKNDRLIKADAGHNLKDQRFKIIRITKPLKGIVTVYAEHVSYLAQDLALRPRVVFSGNAEQALLSWKDGLVDDNPFIVSSDITTRGNGTWNIDEVENPRRALGGIEGSLLDVYGGEYRFDNYQIRLMRQRGVNSATLIAYGRNLVDLTQEEEISNTYTSIYPYSVFTDDDGNPQLVTLPEYYIDSQYVDNFARRKILSVDFSQDEIETVSALRSAANRYITANNVGVPKVNLKIQYVDLAKTLDYKNQAVLEEVNLCDNVPIYFEKFDINTMAKVIKVVWDDLRQQYDSVEIGEARSSLSQSINATVDGKLDKVEKKINVVQLQADGMKLIYRQVEEPPPGSHVGDLWYQPNGIYEVMHQWDGAVWKEVFNTQDLEVVKRDVDEALEDANDARNQATEAVANANLATQNATEAITQAQTAFDSAQNALTTATGLTNRMISVEGDISVLSQTTQSFATRITNAEGGISTLTQTAQGLQTRIANAEGDISSVTQLANGMQTRLTNAEGSINTLTQTATSLDSTIKSVRADLDGLEIGGRNYLQNTSEDFKNYDRTHGWGDWASDESHTGIPVAEGETYTVRVYLKYTTGTKNAYVMARLSDTVGGSTPRNDYYGNKISPNSEGYSELTFTVPTGRKFLRINTVRFDSNVNERNVLQYKELQLEKGNKATDWSPAPEDMATQSQITQLSDNINLRVVHKNDIINQINISTESILISGKKLILDGDTTVTGMFRVKSANIESVDAGKVTTGTLNAGNVNIINMNASNITSGTINTANIMIRGGSATDYTMIDGSTFEARGKYTRTWFNDTKTHDVRFQFKDGLMRVENITESKRLWYSDTGVATFKEGFNDENPNAEYHGSGVIEFFSHMFDPNVRGLTLFSNRGTIGLKTNYRDIVLDADKDVNIIASRGVINLRPVDGGRTGNNHFQFYVKSHSSPSDTDGVLRYGSPLTNYGSGIRFKKSSVGRPTVYATNGNGDIGTGNVDADRFIGSLQTRNKNAYVMTTYDGELRVTNTEGYDGGDIYYTDVRARHYRGNSFRVNDSGANLYLGTSTGEVRVTTNELSSGSYRPLKALDLIATESVIAGNNGRLANDNGQRTYIQGNGDVSATRFKSGTLVPMRASDFNSGSLEEYKQDIHEWNVDILDIYRNDITIYDYMLNSDVEDGVLRRRQGLVIGDGYNTPNELINGDGVAQYQMNSWNMKAIQSVLEITDDHNDELSILRNQNEQLTMKVAKLERRINILEVA